jgi:hypothetical protein
MGSHASHETIEAPAHMALIVIVSEPLAQVSMDSHAIEE